MQQLDELAAVCAPQPEAGHSQESLQRSRRQPRRWQLVQQPAVEAGVSGAMTAKQAQVPPTTSATKVGAVTVLQDGSEKRRQITWPGRPTRVPGHAGCRRARSA